jgi:hypothetical protein
MKSRPRGSFKGLMMFSKAWTEVTEELIVTRGKLRDFNARAPSGADRAISSLDIAALFVTAAQRAAEPAANSVFDQTAFTPVWIAGELEPHGTSLHELTPKSREAATRRVNRHMRDQMAVLVEFGLFTKVVPGRYKLTDLGYRMFWKLNGGEAGLAVAAE